MRYEVRYTRIDDEGWKSNIVLHTSNITYLTSCPLSFAYCSLLLAFCFLLLPIALFHKKRKHLTGTSVL